MIRIRLGAMALALLTACGVEGPPVRPTLDSTISMGSGGVYGHVGTRVSLGGINIGVGVGQ